MKDDFLGHTVASLLTALSTLKKEPITYLETGTMRHEVLEKGEAFDARSTVAAAQWLDKHHGKGLSIDNYAPHVELSRKVLRESNLSSVEVVLGTLGPVVHERKPLLDFVLLDSASNGENTWTEYQDVLVYMKAPALIVIDDIGRNGVNKGSVVLKRTTLNWRMVARYVVAIPLGVEAERLLHKWVEDYKVRNGLE